MKNILIITIIIYSIVQFTIVNAEVLHHHFNLLKGIVIY